MPAPILTGPPAVPAPIAEGAVAAPAPSDPLQFDVLLAAALAGTVQGKADAVPALAGEPALVQAEDQTAGSAQPADPEALQAATPARLPDSLLSVIVPAPTAGTVDVPSEDIAGTDAGTVHVVDPRAAEPGLPQAPAILPALGARTESAPPQAIPGPRLDRPEPAKIAAMPPGSASAPAPESGMDAAAASRPATQLAVVEPGAPHELAPLQTTSAPDAPANPASLAGERSDPGARAAGQPMRFEIAAPVGSREFGADLGNRLVWMATNNHQVAELRIDPPQLGPLELRLSLANDQASLSITSPHAAVRDAIQASLPRLQDMLQGLGINLGNVSVGAEAFGQGHFDHPAMAQHPGESGRAPTAYPVPSSAGIGGVVALPAIGVIDVYA
jgi:flagellar hook-length control protein FliK